MKYLQGYYEEQSMSLDLFNLSQTQTRKKALVDLVQSGLSKLWQNEYYATSKQPHLLAEYMLERTTKEAEETIKFYQVRNRLVFGKLPANDRDENESLESLIETATDSSLFKDPPHSHEELASQLAYILLELHEIYWRGRALRNLDFHVYGTKDDSVKTFELVSHYKQIHLIGTFKQNNTLWHTAKPGNGSQPYQEELAKNFDIPVDKNFDIPIEMEKQNKVSAGSWYKLIVPALVAAFTGGAGIAVYRNRHDEPEGEGSSNDGLEKNPSANGDGVQGDVNEVVTEQLDDDGGSIMSSQAPLNRQPVPVVQGELPLLVEPEIIVATNVREVSDNDLYGDNLWEDDPNELGGSGSEQGLPEPGETGRHNDNGSDGSDRGGNSLEWDGSTTRMLHDDSGSDFRGRVDYDFSGESLNKDRGLISGQYRPESEGSGSEESGSEESGAEEPRAAELGAEVARDEPVVEPITRSEIPVSDMNFPDDLCNEGSNKPDNPKKSCTIN